MEKKDYSKFKEIKLEELQIKFIDTKLLENYSEIFKSKNIKTLEELLIADDQKAFESRRKQENITIKGMCDLIRYIYLKEPLEQGIRLEDEISTEYDPFFISYRRLGLTKKEEMIIKEFHKNQNQKNLRIIDVLNLFSNNKKYQDNLLYKIGETYPQEIIIQEIQIINNLNAKILYLTNYYKKKYGNKENEEVQELIKKRETILKQIEILQNELELVNLKISITNVDEPSKNHTK